MRKVLLVTATIAALCGPALSADLPIRTQAPAVAPEPIFTWTGLHAGGNVGYAFQDQSRLEGSYALMSPALGAAAGRSLTTTSGGIAGGVQVGYDYQFGGGMVLGIETDIDAVDVTGARAVPTAVPGLTASYRSVLDAVGTVRGRLGYGFGPLLAYGTGGLAYGIGNRRGELSAATGPLATVDLDGFEYGYAVGGGIEYALPASLVGGPGAGGITIRAEYLRYALDFDTRPLAVMATVYTLKIHDDGNLGRLGVNYRF